MSRSRVVFCIGVAGSLLVLVALVLALRDRDATGERLVVPAHVDDDGSAGLPLVATPTDPRLPDATLLAPLPDVYVTDVLDARPFTPVVIEPPPPEPEPEPEPAPLTSSSTPSSRWGDAATGLGLLLLAMARVRRARHVPPPAGAPVSDRPRRLDDIPDNEASTAHAR